MYFDPHPADLAGLRTAAAAATGASRSFTTLKADLAYESTTATSALGGEMLIDASHVGQMPAWMTTTALIGATAAGAGAATAWVSAVEKFNSAVELLNVSLMVAQRQDYGVKVVAAPADASYLQIAELNRQHASAMEAACNVVLANLQAEYTKALQALDDSAHQIAAFLKAAEPGAKASSRTGNGGSSNIPQAVSILLDAVNTVWRRRGRAISAGILNLATKNHIDRLEQLVVANIDSTSRGWMAAADAEAEAAEHSESLLQRVVDEPDFVEESNLSKSLRAAGAAGQVLASGYGAYEDHKHGESWGQAITSQTAGAGLGIAGGFVGGAAGAGLFSFGGSVDGAATTGPAAEIGAPAGAGIGALAGEVFGQGVGGVEGAKLGNWAVDQAWDDGDGHHD